MNPWNRGTGLGAGLGAGLDAGLGAGLWNRTGCQSGFHIFL